MFFVSLSQFPGGASFHPSRSHLSANFFFHSGLISSILRFHVFFAHNASADVTWTASKLMPLTIVETGIYLIAACLLTFRPLAIYIWRKTPLSIIHLGSAPHNPRGAEGAHSEDSKNRLRTSKTMGFTRLGKDERTNISSISENGEG